MKETSLLIIQAVIHTTARRVRAMEESFPFYADDVYASIAYHINKFVFKEPPKDSFTTVSHVLTRNRTAWIP
jgi:hypothetical protein